jgi:uncharacterized membrane protein
MESGIPQTVILLAHTAGSVPKEIVVMWMAMLPILELRGAIPFAICAKPALPVASAYIFAVVGNFIPVIPILLFLRPVSDYLRKVPVFDRFFTWLFARTRRRGRLVEKYEAIGLTMFVAIPLPVTGAWTGALLAFIFGIRLKYAVPCILAGILIAGVVVTLAAKGVLGVVSCIV